MRNLTFRDCVFEDNAQGGVTANNHYSADWRNIVFDGCVFRGNGADGISTVGAAMDNSMVIRGCLFDANDGAGMYAIGTIGLRVIECRFFSNENVGLRLDNCAMFDVSNSSMVQSAYDGVFLSHDAGSTYLGTIRNCLMQNNGRLLAASRRSGLYSQSGYGSGSCGLRLVGNRTGNSATYGDATQEFGFFLEGIGSRGVHMAINDHDGNTAGALNTGGGDNNTGGTHVDLVEP
jgi:hypothetical protein